MYQRVGTEFGKYHVRRVLGAGGMASVYYALDSNGQAVALKILSPQLAVISSFRQRFELEAQINSLLSHPNIVPVVDYGAAGDELYIAMRFMPGGSLHDRFVLEGAISLQETARYLEQLASALDYAHTQGVIHRDLKLANVLLDDERRPMLSDFGIARLVESSLHLTESGAVLGSPHYMSPEQNEGKPLDARSDLYSLAVMAYLMITGQFPFHGDTPVAIALQHVTKIPPPPSALNPALPLAIDAVLLKGLEKSPTNRFKSASEFAGAFSRTLGNIDTRTVIRVAQLSAFQPDRYVPANSRQAIQAPIYNPGNGHDDRITPVHPPITTDSKPVRPVKRRPSLTYLSMLTALFGALVLLFWFGLTQLGSIGGISVSPTVTASATESPVGSGRSSITATPIALLLPTLTSTSVVAIPSSFSAIGKDLYTPVNVRAGPSTAYVVIGQLYTDDEGLIFARTVDTKPIWYLIRTSQGKVGWVSGDVIDVLPTSDDPARVPTASSGTIPPEPTPVNPLTPTVQARG